MIFYLSAFFTWILKASVLASVLVIFILIARHLLKTKLQPKWTYFLWILLVLRLLLPSTPESYLSVFNIFTIENIGSIESINRNETNEPVVIKAIDQVFRPADQPFQSAAPTSNNDATDKDHFSFSFMNILSLIWLIGLLVSVSLMLAVNIRFNCKVKNEPVLQDTVIQGVFDICKSEMKIRRPIPLILSSQVSSATLIGVIRPKILLPSSLISTLSERQLKYLFLHELSHIKRKDIAVNWLMNFLLAVHWFNPLLWYAYHKMREDQELACDALALTHIDTEESKDYALTIIKLLEVFSNPIRLAGTASISGSKKELKRRIIMIKSFKKHSYKSTLLGMAVILVLSGSALTSAKSNDTKPIAANGDVIIETVGTIEDLATVWANALLSSRDGKPRYEMMSEQAKAKFTQEQIVRSGADWNFNIGYSSPWVIDYEIEVDGMKANITYLTQTSVPEYYNSKETLIFIMEDNKLVVDDYQYVFEDKLIEK